MKETTRHTTWTKPVLDPTTSEDETSKPKLVHVKLTQTQPPPPNEKATTS